MWFDAQGSRVPAPKERLFNDLGLLFYAKARYADAEPFYRRALAIDEASYGPDVSLAFCKPVGELPSGNQLLAAIDLRL